jgi:hypothetical protein
MKFIKLVGTAMFLGGIGYVFLGNWKMAVALYIMVFGSNIITATNLHKIVDDINNRLYRLERKK